MAHTLDDPIIQTVLAREHALSEGDDARLESIRAKIDAAKQAGTFTYDMYPNDVYLCIEPAMGVFLNLCARSLGAKTIVEFGTSFGVSTIYLAAAAIDTGGRVIGTELEPSKAEKAHVNLSEAGLSDVVDLRIGDALETLKDIDGPVDLLFLDGWKDLYVPVTEMMQPKLAKDAVVLADNIHTFPAEMKAFTDYMGNPEGIFRSVTLPFDSGLHYSVKTRPS